MNAYYIGRCAGDAVIVGIGLGKTLNGLFTSGSGGAAIAVEAASGAGLVLAPETAAVVIGGIITSIDGAMETAYGLEMIRQDFGKYQESKEKEEDSEGGKGTNKIPDNNSVTRHIFRDAEGHIPDTPENRTLLENVANNAENFRGTDKYGNEWYTKILEDGREVWVESRNGNIFDGGINETPKPWNPNTGLKKQ